MKKLLSVLLAALLLAAAIPLGAVSVSAATYGTYGHLTYKIVDGEVTITDCDESALLTIKIPDEIEGYSVTAIGDSAFSDCVNLEFVWLPEDISVIGDCAFFRCTSLAAVFGEIYGSIGEDAFFGCSALASIDLRYVSSIGEGAFWGCRSLKTVTFKRITTLPYYAFYDCTSLTEVNMGENITSIQTLAFSGCSNLTYISIPAQVTSIAVSAFDGCSSLTDVYYGGTSSERPSGLAYVRGATVHYSTLYGKCGANSSWTFHTDTSKLVISGTGNISGDWGYLTPRYVILEEGITGVGSTTFGYTYGDVYVLSLPSTLTSIGNESFMCGARTVILNGTEGLHYGGVDMRSDGYLFFHNTTVLHSDYPAKTNYSYTDTITLNGKMYYVSTDDRYSKHHHNYQNFSMDGFTGMQCYYCMMPRDDSDLSYKLEGGTITINECIYNRSIENGYPTEVTIPDTILGYPVTRIGKEAFYNCKPLTSVTIPESVTSIGNSAFNGCSSLMNIEVDADNAFYSSLDGVLFNKKQTTLMLYPGGKEGDYTIPNSVTTIGGDAFSGCSSLTSVTIPDSVTSIGEWVFSGCDSLTSVTIPESVTSIGEYAFYDCDSLISVTIGDSVPSIGEHAFSSCPSLTSVTIGDSVTTIGRYAFYYCTSLQSVIIGDSVTSIGEDAFSWCTSLTSVTIPDSVTSIGEDAFNGCDSLTDVYYTGSKEDKANITIGYYGNTYLTSATWHYNACKHKYDNACDVDCNLCYELREVAHSVKHVAAVAATTCSAMGNIEYWYCDVCGYAWLDAACTLNTNLKAVILPALEHVYDNAHDADCNVCGETREVGEHIYDNVCDADCNVCGFARESIGHVYDNACDVDCNRCYELREVTHSVKHVAAAAATCTAMGNIEYWYCDICGYAWLDAACTLNTNLKAVILPMAEHIYDDEYDADCNECGEVREVAVPGDANGDGAVNARDAALLQQYVAGWDVTLNEASADTNGDGSVNARDAAILQQYVAGWDVTLGT